MPRTRNPHLHAFSAAGVAQLSLGLALLSGVASAQQAWVPVWSDEFNGSQLSTANWEVMTGNGQAYGNPGWGNNELQYYTGRTQNIVVGGGLLNIIARAENFGGYNYTSARIRSLNLRDFTYGRFEARMKVPAGQGLWPACWMLASTNTYGGWASSGEIDIMETINSADSLHGTIHHGGAWPANTSNGGSRAGDWDAAFHVYSMEWEPDEIRWLVDGTEYYRTTSAVWYSTAAPSNDRAPFDRPFHLLFNLAVGGNWPGNPNGSTVFPATFQIDYIRVEQRPPQSPLSGSPRSIPARIEAEAFDLGGATFAYFDTEAANQGGQFRTQEGVDIEVCAEGGHNVGWFKPGEWMEYTVGVPQTGRYQLRLRTATTATGCTFRLAQNGTNVIADTPIATTSGWQSYSTRAVDANLTAGVQVLRLTNTSGAGKDFNVNWIEIVLAGDANGDGRATIEDLYAFESGSALFPDVDGDGTPSTAADRQAVIAAIRSSDRTP